MERGLDWEPYHFNGRRRRRGPGRSFFDWQPESVPVPRMVGRPLINAIQKNDLLSAQGIVMARADLNEDRDDFGRTALHLAAKNGFAGLVRILADNAADLNSCVARKEPHTALHLAALNGHTQVLRVLLDARVEPNPPSEHAHPPLGLVAGDGNTEAVRLLLKARAHTDIYDESGESLPEATPHGFSALLHATERNADRSVVEELILANANLAATDAEMNQPLHLAVRKGNLRVVRLLLDARADPNCCNAEFCTPMHAAVGVGEARAVSLLVQYHGDLHLQDSIGLAPLDVAADSLTRQVLSKLAAGQARNSKLTSSSSTPAIPPAASKYRLTPNQVLAKSSGGLAKAHLAPSLQLGGLKSFQAPPSSGRSGGSSSPTSPVSPVPVAESRALLEPASEPASEPEGLCERGPACEPPAWAARRLGLSRPRAFLERPLCACACVR